MRAIVKRSRDAGDLVPFELNRPEVAPGKVVIRVAYAGVCKSDIDIIDDRTDIYQPPVALGHEFSGVVTEVGEGVTSLQVGDQVVSQTALDVCDSCQACDDGYYEICESKAILGWTHNGGFADYVLASERFCYKIDRSVDLRAAALAEVLAIGVEGVLVRGKLRPGDAVAVVGPGPCGLLAAYAALRLGASKVLLVGRESFTPEKMRRAHGMGLKHCIDSTVTDPIRYLREINNGRLADLVIDATGSISGFDASLELVKRHGRLVEVGSITAAHPFDWPAVAFKAVDLSFAFSSGFPAWDAAVRILHEHPGEIVHAITHVFDLEDYQQAIAAARSDFDSIKVLMAPSGE